MEYGIAIGIGLWFVLCGVVSYMHVNKTFKSKNGDDDK